MEGRVDLNAMNAINSHATGAGPDGIWFTQDDDLDHYSIY